MPLIDYVNIKQGTKSTVNFSNGNTLPIISLPHGMSNFCVQTDISKGNWWFDPDSGNFEGIRLTHQPSPWIGDYGAMLIIPSSKDKLHDNKKRYSRYDNKNSVFMPHYMKINLPEDKISMEATPSDSGAAVNINFKKGYGNLCFKFFKGLSLIRFNENDNSVTGYTEFAEHTANFALKEYIYIKLDDKPDSFEIFNAKSEMAEDNKIEDEGAGINLFFNKCNVKVKFSVSFLSQVQAKVNYENELAKKSFLDIYNSAEQKWEEVLSLIEIEAPEKIKRTFYSCMYRSFLYPRKFYEINENGEFKHINLKNGNIENGVLFTDNGFWDTYRTVYPLYSIIAPETYRIMLEGFYNFAKDTGALPRWISPVEIGVMPGCLIEAVIADGAVKGIISKEFTEKFLPYLEKQSSESYGNNLQGRQGVEDYVKYGYLPDDKHKESVNNTLDCAYGDYCIAQAEKISGNSEKYGYYINRSRNYKNLFDYASGFMRGKDSGGNFSKKFDPYEWGGSYCEGSAWQNSFSVYHDMEGLAALYGGSNLIKKIDELFSAKPKFNVGTYGCVIHEMSEMAAAKFGQMAISNQPSFHIPYIYAELNQPEKTFKIIKKLAKAFSSGNDGFPGDEDNGSMAAWYIFAVIGLYPFCPGRGDFLVNKPLYNCKIHIEGRVIKRQYKSAVIKNKITFEELKNTCNSLLI